MIQWRFRERRNPHFRYNKLVLNFQTKDTILFKGGNFTINLSKAQTAGALGDVLEAT